MGRARESVREGGMGGLTVNLSEVAEEVVPSYRYRGHGGAWL